MKEVFTRIRGSCLELSALHFLFVGLFAQSWGIPVEWCRDGPTFTPCKLGKEVSPEGAFCCKTPVAFRTPEWTWGIVGVLECGTWAQRGSILEVAESNWNSPCRRIHEEWSVLIALTARKGLLVEGSHVQREANLDEILDVNILPEIPIAYSEAPVGYDHLPAWVIILHDEANQLHCVTCAIVMPCYGL